MMWNEMGGWWGMGFGWIVPLFIIAMVVWMVTSRISRNRSDSGAPSRNSALEILKERYARGELSKEEFESMRKEIA